MKTSKKLISLLLVLVLSLSMSVTALAQTSSQDEILESLGLQNVSPAAIGFATDYNSLRSLITSKVENIIVLNDIQMLDTLTIDYNVLFATPLTKVSLMAAQGKRHFNVTGGDITIEVQESYGGRVYLDGDYIGGGINTNTGLLTIVNLGITHCYGDGALEVTGGDITLAGSTDISENQTDGVVVNSEYTFVTIDDSTSITYNESHGIIASSNSYCGITMYNGEISYNHAGGIFIHFGGVDMNGGFIEGNSDGYEGGGIYAGQASVYISGGRIANNFAHHSGGGVFSRATVYVTGGTIENNWARYFGGGIFGDSIRVANASVADNVASVGGGIYSNYYIELEDCSITGNTAGDNGGGVFSGGSGRIGPNVYFSGNTPDDIFWG